MSVQPPDGPTGDTPVGTDDLPGTGGPASPAAPPRGPGRNPVPIVVAIVAVVALALVALLATAGGDNQDPDTAAEVLDDAAPELAGETIDGGRFDLTEHEGGWMVVNFFATWCPPCVAEHPELTAFSTSNAFDAGVVSVAFDEPAETVAAFFDEHGGDWPVVAQSEEIPLDWGVIGLPESFLVSPQGTVAKKYKGQVTAAGLEADIRELS